MRISLVVVCCLGSFFVSAQNVSVDPLTGSLNVGIPLWTVKSGDLSVPVTLFHSGNGMKVNAGEGNAGMMWSVSAGGTVTREVRGLPDDLVGAKSIQPNDYRNGWLYANYANRVHEFIPTGDTILSDCSDEHADYDSISNISYARDTEPDIFSFHAPGLSGQFVFDRNKIVRMIPFQDLRVVFFRGADSLINKFEITNNLGVKYTFMTTDDVRREASKKAQSTIVNHFGAAFYYYNEKKTRFSRSWGLTEIKSPAGAAITLTYTFADETTGANWYRQINGSSIDSIYCITDRVISSRLNTISGASDAVGLNWSGDRLGQVVIADNAYQDLKKFRLSYDFIVTGGANHLPPRSFLTGLVEEVNCNAFPGYKFEYYGMDLALDTTSIPFHQSYGQDLFGYHSAGSGQQAAGVYVKSGDTGVNGERFRIAPASGYAISGGARGIDSSKVYFGSLKSIILPSGGRTTIEYEPADYHDHVTGSTVWGAGVRVKRLKTSANDPASDVTTKYRYKTSGGQSSGRWIYRPMFAFGGNDVIRVPDNLGLDESIMYSRVETSSTGRGSTVYEYTLPAMYPTVSTNLFEVPVSRVARPDIGSCMSVGAFKPGRHTYPFAPNVNYDFERGLPLSVTDYTRDNKIVSKKLYTYQHTSLEAELVSGLRFEPFGVGFVFSKYKVLSNLNNLIATETSRLYDQSDATNTKYVESSTSYTYNGNQMLSQVSFTNSDESSHFESIKYAKDYPGSGTDLQSQMINGLVSANRHGTPVETVSRNGSNVISAQLTLFNNNFGGSRILPSEIKVLAKTSGFTDSNVSGSAFVYSSNYLPAAYIESYDDSGTPLTSRDRSRNIQSMILANKSFPVLKIDNARNYEVVYADFEPFTYSQLPQHTGTVNSSESWSGRKSLTLNTGNTITQNSVIKGMGTYYRVSCWAKAAGAVTLTVKFDPGSGWVQDTVKYPASAAGKWTFITKRINMQNVTAGASFNFQVSAPSTIHIDNLLFYPEAADVVATAYDPLNGTTAVLSGTGAASFSEYDNMGRLRLVKNQDKDIVKVLDYHYKSPTAPAPTSMFDYTWDNGPLGVTTQSAVTFTAAGSCMGGVTYAWYVDGVQQASIATSMQKSFPENKQYRVKLVAGSIHGNNVTELCVQPIPIILADAALQSGESLEFNCQEGSPVRHLEVDVSGPYDAGTLKFRWYRKLPTLQSETLLAETNTPTYAFPLIGGDNNELRCEITGISSNQHTDAKESVSASVSVTVFWNSQGPC